MKIKLDLLKRLINEEAQKLNEARYKVTRDDVKTLQRGLNLFFIGDDVDEDAPNPGSPGFDEYMAKMKNKVSKDLKVDGIFGKNTRSDLMDFQEIAGLTQDGVAGPKTFRSLALEIRDESSGMPDAIKAAYENEARPIAAELDRLSGEKALMGRRRRKKKKPDAEKKPALGGRKATPEKGRSSEENKAEKDRLATRARMRARAIGAEMGGDLMGTRGSPVFFSIDRPNSELEQGENSDVIRDLKAEMMALYNATQRSLDEKDIEVQITDPREMEADLRPPELKGKIRILVTGPGRKKTLKVLSDKEQEEFEAQVVKNLEESKIFDEATEKLRVLREARRRK